MRILVLLMTAALTSCTPTRKSTTQDIYIKMSSPGDNGLCTYYLKSKGMRGTLKLVDSNYKYHVQDKFILKEVTTQ